MQECLVLGFLMLLFSMNNDGIAQEIPVDRLSEKQVQEKLTGIWKQTHVENRKLFEFEKVATPDTMPGPFRLEIRADGTLTHVLHPIDHLGRKRFWTDEYTWTYQPEKQMLRMVLMQYGRSKDTVSYIVRNLSDSALMLTTSDVIAADSVLSFLDFERIERFIRTYGNRKTFGNRWNDNPHFTFPEGEVYLFPYFENPVRYEPLPYYYYGFILYHNNGRSLELEYLNKDYIYCREEDIPLLESVKRSLMDYVSQFPEFPLDNGKLLANEGKYKLSPEDGNESIHIVSITQSEYEQHEEPPVISLLAGDTVKTVGFEMPYVFGFSTHTKNYLRKIEQVSMHSKPIDLGENIPYSGKRFFYDLYFELSGKEYRMHTGFFGNNGVVEEIKAGGYLKVRYVPPYKGKELPASYFYYKLALDDR